MAKNHAASNALHISLPVPDGTLSGEPVKVGSFVGVAITDKGAGGNAATDATVWRDGSWRLEVDGEVTAIGQPIYITETRTLTTIDDADGVDDLWGYALETKAAAAAVIEVVVAQV
jgi:predicted RecA/RadA family phage recombinase